MMTPDIEAIFLDVGNTLRIVIKDEPYQAEARKQLIAIAETKESTEEFFAKMDVRWKAYRKWSFENLLEASEKELWTKFLLPDLPEEKIAPLAGKLTRLWRDKDGRREPRDDVKKVVLELSKRGYILGIIANTITETEIPDWLERDGLTSHFKSIVLSSKFRHRKPGPEIYWEAAKRAGIDPVKCAYVGDNPDRDVVGTRKAGFGTIIILIDPEKHGKEAPTGECIPDKFIKECSDLLDIFPPRK